MRHGVVDVLRGEVETLLGELLEVVRQAGVVHALPDYVEREVVARLPS